jgi:hypothetical protein
MSMRNAPMRVFNSRHSWRACARVGPGGVENDEGEEVEAAEAEEEEELACSGGWRATGAGCAAAVVRLLGFAVSACITTDSGPVVAAVEEEELLEEEEEEDVLRLFGEALVVTAARGTVYARMEPGDTAVVVVAAAMSAVS